MVSKKSRQVVREDVYKRQAAGRAGNAASGSCVDDRGGRRIDPDHCVLERRGELYVDEVGFDRDFCCRSMAVKKEKLESDSCDGAERFCKAGSAGCACAGWHSMIR